MVLSDALEGVIIAHVNICRDSIQLSTTSVVSDGGPISISTAVDCSLTQGKGSSCNGCLLLVDVGVCSLGSTRLGVDGSKAFSNSSKSELSLKGDDDLPMEESGFGKFKLARNVRTGVWKVGCKAFMRNSQNPVASLVH